MKKPFSWSYSALSSFELCAKKHWHQNVRKDYRQEETEPMRYGKYVHKAIEDRIIRSTPLPLDLIYLEEHICKYADTQAPTHGEQKLAINHEYKPTGWFADDVFCRAIIDLLVLGENIALIIDWKTGKEKDDFMQLQLMALMIMLHYPQLNTVHASFFYTRSKKPVQVKVSKTDAPRLWAELLPRVEKMRYAFEHEEFPANPNPLCKRYCPVTGCPYHGE